MGGIGAIAKMVAKEVGKKMFSKKTVKPAGVIVGGIAGTRKKKEEKLLKPTPLPRIRKIKPAK